MLENNRRHQQLKGENTFDKILGKGKKIGK